MVISNIGLVSVQKRALSFSSSFVGTVCNVSKVATNHANISVVGKARSRSNCKAKVSSCEKLQQSTTSCGIFCTNIQAFKESSQRRFFSSAIRNNYFSTINGNKSGRHGASGLSTSQNRYYCVMSDSNMAQQEAPVIFRQLFEHKSYTYTYLLACMRTKEAVLIDPVIEMVPRDIRIMEQLGISLKYAINTHVHADHITGSGKLKQELPGVTSVLGIDSGAKADTYLDQGEKLHIGDIELEARKTPGHTNGCMTYVWHNHRRLFAGDVILIRGCGRTDFQQGSAAMLYTSVHSQIFSLPEDYVIYPAHDYTGQPWTTVGEEKRYNPRLTKTREEFIELMNNLNLPYPKQIDRALPANLLCGVVDEPPDPSTS